MLCAGGGGQIADYLGESDRRFLEGFDQHLILEEIVLAAKPGSWVLLRRSLVVAFGSLPTVGVTATAGLFLMYVGFSSASLFVVPFMFVCFLFFVMFETFCVPVVYLATQAVFSWSFGTRSGHRERFLD